MPEQNFSYPSDIAKEVIICFLQAFFGEKPRGEAGWHYLEDEDKSSLFICDKFSFNREVAEQRAGLFIDRGAMRWAGRHIDQLVGTAGAGASKIRGDLIECGVRVNCVSKQGIEAEHLAQMIFMLVTIFKDEFRKVEGVHHVLSTAVGSESILRADSHSDLHLVPCDLIVRMHKAFLLFEKGAPLLEEFRIIANDPEKVKPKKPAPAGT